MWKSMYNSLLDQRGTDSVSPLTRKSALRMMLVGIT